MQAFRWWSLAFVLGVGAVACGGAAADDDGDDDESEETDDEKDSDKEKQGFVRCGEVTCQPGQFCKDESQDYCELGCQSNINCAADQSCEEISDVTHVGTCMQAAAQEDQLARCKDACSQMVSCGLLAAAEGSDCQAACASADEATQRSVADCVSSWTCEAPLPACLGIECGGAYECGGVDETCVDGACL